MDIDERWIYALASLIVGGLVGVFLAGTARRLLGRPARRPALRSIAAPTGTFLFWLSLAAGVVVAVGFTSPESLEPIPSDILAWLPRVLAAGLILLTGYAVGGTLSVTLAGTAHQALGQRPAGVEMAVRWGVLGAAAILAMTNLGVEATTLHILTAGVVVTVGITMALLAGLGGRSVASSVAAGRILRDDLAVGDRVEVVGVAGTVVALKPAVVVLDQGDGARLILAYSTLLENPVRLVRPAPDVI